MTKPDTNELDEILDNLGCPRRSPSTIKAKAKLRQWAAQEANKARLDELKLMLNAEYSRGTFSTPSESLNIFLENTPLIASYILRDRIAQLTEASEVSNATD